MDPWNLRGWRKVFGAVFTLLIVPIHSEFIVACFHSVMVGTNKRKICETRRRDT
jgi:hypothetical protein